MTYMLQWVFVLSFGMKKKNIIFIFPDQLRADFLGCYGAKFAKTFNIDNLASKSYLYKRAISPSPICVPARASLLTGYNTIVNGVNNNSQWLRPDHEECGFKTWPRILSENGYHTQAIGKMHFYPWDINEGFDERIIAEDKRHIYIKDDYYEYLKKHGYEKYHGTELDDYVKNKGAAVSKIPLEHQVDRWVANKTCEFLNDYDKDKPFALMVGFPGPHCPYDPPKEYLDLFSIDDMPDSVKETTQSRVFMDEFIEVNKQKWNGVDYKEFSEEQKKRIKAYYCALIYQIDLGVGAILDKLVEKGIDKETIVIFSSDHGDYVGDFGYVGKTHFFEPSISVPLIIYHPDLEGGKEVDSLVSLTDINATIRSFAGVDTGNSKDSKVLAFMSKSANEREYIYAPSNLGFMVLKGEYKYCKYYNGLECLFNIKLDKEEQFDLSEDEKYADMIKEFNEIILKDTFESISLSNQDNIVKRGGSIGEGEFGYRNWKRKYPNKVISI